MKEFKISVVVLLVLVLFSSSIVLANDDFDTKEWTRSSRGEGVWIDTIFNPNQLEKDIIEFKVYLTTHSGNLLDLNLDEISKVKTSLGKVRQKNISWEWERESSHHPVGIIKVNNQNQNLFNLSTETIELTIDSIRGIKHTLRWELEAKSNENYAYISNATSGTVSVVNTKQHKVINTIKVADQASHGLAVDNLHNQLYVGDYSGGNLYVFSLPEGELIKKLNVNSPVHGIDISPNNKHLYLAGGSKGSSGNVLVVDTANNIINKKIITNGAGHINFSPDGKYAYVSNVDRDEISVIDTAKQEVLNKVQVGDGPNEAIASLDNKYLYTANFNEGSMTVVETGTWKTKLTKKIDEGTHGIIISPDGKYIWLTNRGTNTITIIDTDNYEIIKELEIEGYANHISMNPTGDFVYITDVRDNQVIVLDARKFTKITEFSVGNEPHEIVFN
ncbi:YncE family protein [Halanaerobaculum tunisiense]